MDPVKKFFFIRADFHFPYLHHLAGDEHVPTAAISQQRKQTDKTILSRKVHFCLDFFPL